MKRFSFGGMVSSAISGDTVDIADLDSMMKGLYCEFDTLEQRCFESVTGSGKIIIPCTPAAAVKSPEASNSEKSKDAAVEEVVQKLPIEYFTPSYTNYN